MCLVNASVGNQCIVVVEGAVPGSHLVAVLQDNFYCRDFEEMRSHCVFCAGESSA